MFDELEINHYIIIAVLWIIIIGLSTFNKDWGLWIRIGFDLVALPIIFVIVYAMKS